MNRSEQRWIKVDGVDVEECVGRQVCKWSAVMSRIIQKVTKNRSGRVDMQETYIEVNRSKWR